MPQVLVLYCSIGILAVLLIYTSFLLPRQDCKLIVYFAWEFQTPHQCHKIILVSQSNQDHATFLKFFLLHILVMRNFPFPPLCIIQKLLNTLQSFLNFITNIELLLPCFIKFICLISLDFLYCYINNLKRRKHVLKILISKQSKFCLFTPSPICIYFSSFKPFGLPLVWNLYADILSSLSVTFCTADADWLPIFAILDLFDILLLLSISPAFNQKLSQHGHLLLELAIS